MIWINTTVLLVLLGWSIFTPFIFLFIGWWAHEPEELESWW